MAYVFLIMFSVLEAPTAFKLNVNMMWEDNILSANHIINQRCVDVTIILVKLARDRKHVGIGPPKGREMGPRLFEGKKAWWNVIPFGKNYQLMVNWWFSLVIWIPGIPLWKGLLLRLPRYQEPKAAINHWVKSFYYLKHSKLISNWSIYFRDIERFTPSLSDAVVTIDIYVKNDGLMIAMFLLYLNKATYHMGSLFLIIGY